MRALLVLPVFLIVVAGCAGPAKRSDAFVPPPAPAGFAAARELYFTKCARCHELYDPAKYSGVEWNDWMDRMSRKAKLKPEQKEILATYLGTLREGTTTNANQNAPTPPH